jgi:hypothetical protein
MISLPRIVRLAAAHRFDTLLEDVLRNGRVLPLALRLRLAADPETLPATALALGLQRFLELTLGPTPQAIDLARALLDRQRPGDSFGSVPATAAAIAALTLLDDTLAAAPGLDPIADTLRSRIGQAIDDGVAALRDARDNAPSTLLANRPLMGDELDTLIALWQLAPHERLADTLDLPLLLTTLEDLGLRHDRALAPILDRTQAALTPVTSRATRAA